MNEFAARGDMREALIIGQNLFSQNSGDPEIFGSYYTILRSMASCAKSIDEKNIYAQQLTAILTQFSETVSLNDSMIEYIKSKEDSLKLLYDEIQNQEQIFEKENIKSKILENDNLLNSIEIIIAKLNKVSNKNELDSLLLELQRIDSSILNEYLTERQQNLYQKETKKCSEIVEYKIRHFERAQNVEYNLKALEAYEKVYQYFKTGEIPDNHKEIIKGLFQYDLSRLFNETLTYYNHVYSYVLSKLNDDEKFILTKAAIKSEIRR